MMQMRWWVVMVGCAVSPATTNSEHGDAGADLSAVAVEDSGVDSGADLTDLRPPPCPPEMVHVTDPDAGLDFCVDPYEGYVVEITDGGEQPHSPFDVIGSAAVAARTAGGVYPQAYLSQLQATAACQAAGKRLCSKGEFAEFCRGTDPANDYPYGGTTRVKGWCNEGKGSSMPLFFGNNPANWTYANFNDPRLNQWDGGLAQTGSYPHCVSPWGVYDCVGNLHEWGSDPADVNGHGRFRGGFYGDAEINGHGCLYVTSAHELAYHDYSTGFRCCADVR
jgi:Sulfatase-modifying factor enzyme 1